MEQVIARGEVATITGLHISGPRKSWEKITRRWAEDILQNSKEAGLDIGSENYHLAYIEMPCGEGLAINSLDDLPQGDVLCSCGDPRHYFVWFSE